MNKIALLLPMFICILALNCNSDAEPKSTKKTESVSRGAYCINNLTDKNLKVKAYEIGMAGTEYYDTKLLAHKIPPKSKVCIYVFTEGTGGHTMISNAFEKFVVYTGSKVTKGVVYSKVKNDDWKKEGLDSKGRTTYVLTLK